MTAIEFYHAHQRDGRAYLRTAGQHAQTEPARWLVLFPQGKLVAVSDTDSGGIRPVAHDELVVEHDGRMELAHRLVDEPVEEVAASKIYFGRRTFGLFPHVSQG